MLAFSQSPSHNVVMPKPVTRILFPGTPDQVIINITPRGEIGTLTINGNAYHLNPHILPDLDSFQQLLSEEKVSTYLAVVDMMRELAA
jgi:hypothetical protein